MCKVSVIMPVYNAEKYLQESIDSVLGQTFDDFELICVDDGSSDESFSILTDYAVRDDRVKVFKNNEITEGAAEARNIGMRNARGKYLAFLDADDFADSNMLERAYKKAEENQADILMFDAWYFDDDLKVNFATRKPLNDFYLPKKDVFSPLDYKSNIFRMTHGAVWGRLFRKEFIDSNELVFFSCYYWDDIEFFFTAICLAKRIAVLRERLMHYRYNASENQSATFSKHPEIAYKATKEIRRRFEHYGLYEIYKIPLLNLLVDRVFYILNSIDKTKEFCDLFYALKEGELKAVGAYEINDDDYIKSENVAIRNYIESSETPLDFIIKRRKIYRGAYEKSLANLAKETGGCADILVYGAGAKGLGVFYNILNNPMYRLVGWCDKNYEAIGYPVMNPEQALSKYFDFVIIAILDCNVMLSVKKYIISRGIDEKKIIWVCDYL